MLLSLAANLGCHIENLKSFGVPVIVAINHFVKDTQNEINAVMEFVTSQGAEAVKTLRVWIRGSVDLVKRVAIADSDISDFCPIYPTTCH